MTVLNAILSQQIGVLPPSLLKYCYSQGQTAQGMSDANLFREGQQGSALQAELHYNSAKFPKNRTVIVQICYFCIKSSMYGKTL